MDGTTNTVPSVFVLYLDRGILYGSGNNHLTTSIYHISPLLMGNEFDEDVSSGDTMITPSKKEKHNVLVIDRSIRILEILEEWLSNIGSIEVISTTCFDKGLEYVKSDKQTSLVISDHCEKKGRNGLWFLKEVLIHSPKTIRYLTSCCLDKNDLENHKREGDIHFYSTPSFVSTEIIDKVKLGLKLCEGKI